MFKDQNNRLQPETVEELFYLIANVKANRLILLELGKVSLYFSSISKKVTIELVDYKISLDNSSVRHVLKNHSNPVKEKKRGQEAIVEEDFNRVEEIVLHYDNVTFEGKDKSSPSLVLKFTKDIEGKLYTCLFEIRKTQERLNLKTMYKKKRKK